MAENNGWTVTEESVNALNNLATQLEELVTDIHNETAKLRTTFEENEDGLGRHSADISALIEDVEATEQDATAPVKKLVLKLNRAAAIRQSHIDSQHYGRSR